MEAKLCECGCGLPAPIAKATRKSRGMIKGQPLRYLPGHNSRVLPRSAESNAKRSKKLKGRVRSEEEIRKTSVALKGKPHSKQHIANHIRSLAGREPVYSPYIPDLPVKYQRDKNRWYCCDPKNKRRTMTHAKAVYEYFYGQVPEGCHVHHKNGDASNLEYDAPENLMLVPDKWNFDYFPRLAEGFNVPEQLVTEIYARLVEKVSSKVLFREVCRELIRVTE